MKILLLAALTAFAVADVSHLANQNSGYQYENPAPQNAPESSYGAPQSSVLGGSSYKSVSVSGFDSSSTPQLVLPSSGPSASFTGGVSSSSVQSYSGFPSGSFQVSALAPGASNFQVPSTPSVNLVQYDQPNSYQFLTSLNQPSANLPSSVGISSVNSAQFSSDAALNTGFVSKTSGGSIDESFGVATNAAEDSLQSEVSKHLYFFAAPEEEEEQPQAKITYPAYPAKKSYKIIFIKAPTYRNQATITIPAPPQNEEKTLVYVLVKKPEGQPQIKFQDAAPTAQPVKPEVFFIKYKTQKEAEDAVAEIQSKHGAQGQVIANLPAGLQTQGNAGFGLDARIGGNVELGPQVSVESSTPVAASAGGSVQFAGGVSFDAVSSSTPVALSSASTSGETVQDAGEQSGVQYAFENQESSTAASFDASSSSQESSESPRVSSEEEGSVSNNEAPQSGEPQPGFSLYGPPGH